MSQWLVDIKSFLHFWVQLSSFQSLSDVWLFVTPWAAARQASLSITNSWSLLKLTSIQLVLPSNHLIFWQPLLYLSSIFPSIRVFSNESVLHITWPKYWSFSFSISPPVANILLRIFVSMFINELACNFLFMCDNFFGFDIKVMMA